MESKEKIQLSPWAGIISAVILAIAFVAAVINNNSAEDVEIELSPFWILFFPINLPAEDVEDIAELTEKPPA
ncbi:MAG: hypothetical protein N2246_10635, partial [Candidatus Sumerlaeia bacterium]|nr:hypothetical protein [Candidatus Sumerlaeia bacterium]